MSFGFDDDNERIVSLHADYIRETKQAFLFKIDDEEVWLPKSQCDWDGHSSVSIPEWLAIDKDLA